MAQPKLLTKHIDNRLTLPTEGRVPPQAVDIEAQVLGAMMLEVDAICKVVEILKDYDFHADYHRKIFQAIVSLFEAGKSVETISLAEELRRAGHLELIGGEPYLAELTMNVTSAWNVESHAYIVLEKSIMRALITTGSNVANRAYSNTEDALSLLEEAGEAIYEISTRRSTTQRMEGMDSLTHRTLEDIEKAAQNKKHIIGTATGIHEFDNWTLGFEKETMIVVAGRPSQGKSSTMLCMADYISQHSNGCGIFSFEMGSKNQMLKLASHKTGMPFTKIKTGQLSPDEWKQVVDAMAQIQKQKLWIDASSQLSMTEIRAKTMQLISKHNIDGIFLDYLKFIKKPQADRNDIAIGMITGELKQMAKDLKIWVVLLCQLSRPDKGKIVPPPNMFDLKDSSDIEQDADVIAFIHRPETYGQEMFNKEYTRDRAWLLLDKQRNGRTGGIMLDWKGSTMQLLNPTHTYSPRVPSAPLPQEAPPPTQDDLPF